MIYGGGKPFPEDRTTQPIFDSSSLELVSNLSYPPGNIAVAKNSGRVFFTYHPDGHSPFVQLAELLPEGNATAYPSEDFQKHFKTPLSLRFDDESGLLWVLDHGHHGFHDGRFFIFDISTNSLVDEYVFPRDIAGYGSMLNDFQIYNGKIYIADSSLFRKAPAIIIYDIKTKTVQRRLQSDQSVTAKKYDPHIQAVKKDMVILGVFGVRPGVDSIAIDTKGEWLYYASITDPLLYRVQTQHLNNKDLSEEELRTKVQVYANKTMSDGIIMDESFIYITDIEHSAIVGLRVSESPEERVLTTFFKDGQLLRWPDGLSFGASETIYLTCSSIENLMDPFTIFTSKSYIASQAPYQIFKFKKPSVNPSAQ